MSFFINLLTLSRIFLAPVIFILITFDINIYITIFIFLFAGISDFFDGYLARKYNLASKLGETLDPIGDKVLIVFSFLALSIYLHSYLISFLSAVIISREIWVGALRDINSRTNNSAATKVTFLAKIKTSIQLMTIFIYLLALALEFGILLVLADIILMIATLITFYTGLIYTIKTYESHK